MLSIGLDVHLNSTAMCVINSNGQVTAQREVRGTFPAVVEQLKKFKEPLRVCFEASCGYGSLYDLLTPIAAEVQVAHPTELQLRMRSKHKNDRRDALKIAKLLYMDEIPRVHVPSRQVRSWRGLIEHRHRLVGRRTRIKNSLRALLRGLLIECPARRTLWSRKGMQWIKDQALTGIDRFRVDSLLEEIELLSRQIGTAEKELNVIGDAHPHVQLLRTIPGVGPRTAEAVVAYIDQPQRFNHVRAIGKYFGVVPCQDQSGSRNRLGHITREGPSTVRQLITQAAWQTVRRSPGMKAWFQRVKNDQKSRTGPALVAAGHKLLRIMLTMLKTGRPWDESMFPPSQTPQCTTPDALPPSATDNCTEARRPVRRGRGKSSPAPRE